MVFPGSGSLAAGRKVGYFQAALTLAGLTLTALYAFRFFAWYIANRADLGGDSADPLESLAALWRALRPTLAGFGIFALAWLWALVTSCQILAGARNTPVESPPKPERAGTGNGTCSPD